MFKLEFKTTNDAFRDIDGDVDGSAAADVLGHVAALLNGGFTSGPVYDVNGNAAGSWSLG